MSEQATEASSSATDKKPGARTSPEPDRAGTRVRVEDKNDEEMNEDNGDEDSMLDEAGITKGVAALGTEDEGTAASAKTGKQAKKATARLKGKVEALQQQLEEQTKATEQQERKSEFQQRQLNTLSSQLLVTQTELCAAQFIIKPKDRKLSGT
eukprot:11592612-Karenia_brevis.AAC.1